MGIAHHHRDRFPSSELLHGVDVRARLHESNDFRLPDNLRLLFLPPYSPEVNPQEHLWDELREKHFHNRVFDSIDTLDDHLVVALLDLENSPDGVKRIVGWDWIINAASNAN